jgi:hypothetical protein
MTNDKEPRPRQAKPGTVWNLAKRGGQRSNQAQMTKYQNKSKEKKGLGLEAGMEVR